MDNYKIKVKDEAESKEAQELFFKLGLTKEDFDDYKFPYYVASYNDGAFSNYILGSDTSGWEELTLPQLRDLVVLNGKDAELVEQAKRFITPDHLDRFQAAKAHLEGKAVQFMLSNGAFFDITDDSTVGIFATDGGYSFRLKPQTIKVDIEIPAPYKAKIGGRDDTSFVLNVGRHQYCYKNEEDYTKACDALEAVFDAALRGTTS
ncbi:hypothetical protein [Acinetobacter baumannii]|uniref:hypothetical protein n=1 Tax=Acinetobacter baumannii TaxID=470 RepID=UPI00189B270A|nr:hypothetical protein [Acinetobacter baumannii]MBF6937053.1 hypothetical protein [Acinetobacter baumannii]MBH8450160.1 hypothetical protein [Acinetobacter baumannii]MDC3964382.1 hypothetical protein [Acinetobacter baumannii]MDC4085359.1 hypothetical protein [Acinetobacter baumannii]MDC4108993.1 hypothetical protein [Acinetobacter baumannii]